MRNYERIQQMSIEEMAQFLSDIQYDTNEPTTKEMLKGHTAASQICEGVYPEGTTRDEVESVVRGTFGGRFKYFGNGKFKYIAYTD